METLMKKIISLLLLTLCASAMAQHPGPGPYPDNRYGNRYEHRYQHRHGHQGYWARGYGGGWVWMVPALIGGAIIYEAARQQPPVNVQQQPVLVTPQPVQNCTPWTEVQSSDGTITRTRTCTQ